MVHTGSDSAALAALRFHPIEWEELTSVDEVARNDGSQASKGHEAMFTQLGRW